MTVPIAPASNSTTPTSSVFPFRSLLATKVLRTASRRSRFGELESNPALHAVSLSSISGNSPPNLIHPRLDPGLGFRLRSASHFLEMEDKKWLFLAFPSHSVRLK